MQRQRLRPRHSRMERLPLHIGLFLVYVLFQLATTGFSSSSTVPTPNSGINKGTEIPSPELTTVKNSGQKEQVPGETDTNAKNEKDKESLEKTTVGKKNYSNDESLIIYFFFFKLKFYLR